MNNNILFQALSNQFLSCQSSENDYIIKIIPRTMITSTFHLVSIVLILYQSFQCILSSNLSLTLLHKSPHYSDLFLSPNITPFVSVSSSILLFSPLLTLTFPRTNYKLIHSFPYSVILRYSFYNNENHGDYCIYSKKEIHIH